ncbi:glycosyltransferase family 2 protein [Klebsiella spallanzanii]|uniref:Glycosyltransferase EpsH n=1 Tax=Klebsiella spallanzanii TaxID=2587528 RepID=A0A564K3T5_9ENTR|nr:glycosyltransferase family 2 protein [Klebsiella spallanzanii]VUS63799.1 Putative glycosyltransferase EpsH [Klebsiella spallanzanii]
MLTMLSPILLLLIKLMNIKPSVSVILPVFNGQEYISNCVEALLNQRLMNFELIIIDDGSTDQTGEICKGFALNDDRIKLFQKKNGGVSTARNYGIELATGDYICFVDVDDSVNENYLQELFDDRIILGIDSCGIVVNSFSGYIGTRSLPSIIVNSKKNVINSLLSTDILLFSEPYSKLFDRRVIINKNIRFPTGIHMGEDGIFLAQYYKYVTTMNISPKINYFRKIIPTSLSHRMNSFVSEYEAFQLWNNYLDDLFGKDLSIVSINDVKWKISGNLFLRATRSIKLEKSIYKRVEMLKTISDSDWILYGLFKPHGIKSKIKKKILCSKLYLLYSILC